MGVRSLEGSRGGASRGLVAARVGAAHIIQKRACDFSLIGLAVHCGDHGRLNEGGAEALSSKAHLVLEGVSGGGGLAIFTIEDLLGPRGVGKLGSTRLSRSGEVSLASSNRAVESGASLGLVDNVSHTLDELELLELLRFGDEMEGACFDEVPNALDSRFTGNIVRTEVSVGAVRSLVGLCATVGVEFDVSHV